MYIWFTEAMHLEVTVLSITVKYRSSMLFTSFCVFSVRVVNCPHHVNLNSDTVVCVQN